MEIVHTIMFVHQDVDAVQDRAITIGASVANTSAKKARATAEMTMNVKVHLFVANLEAVALEMTTPTPTLIVVKRKISIPCGT